MEETVGYNDQQPPDNLLDDTDTEMEDEGRDPPVQQRPNRYQPAALTRNDSPEWAPPIIVPAQKRQRHRSKSEGAANLTLTRSPTQKRARPGEGFYRQNSFGRK